MARKQLLINAVTKVFADATKQIIEANTFTNITYSKTALKIYQVFLKPDIGCFVVGEGDFESLMIMNFSKEAAIEIYTKYMTAMGMPESDITDNYAFTEVTDSIGELVNQIAGKARQELEKQFGISLKINQPKAIQISSTIMMSIAADINKPQNRRISFKTEQKHPFYLELSIEHTEMISLLSENEDTDNNEKELTIDELIALNRV